MSDFPKFQYSVFTNDPTNGQLVIRADTFQELLTAKEDINKILEKIGAKEVSKSIPVEQFQEMCQNCNIPKVQSKKGNMYCPNKCWLK